MRVGDYLEAIRHLPVISREDLTGGAPIIVLSPHPDDETLGLGGLIAQACEAGQPVHVVVLTDGAGSHPNSFEYPPSRLVEVRKAEVAAAGTILGLDQACVHHLDLPDTRAPSQRADFDSAVAFISDLAARTGARHLFVTWGRDPHCDHEAAAAVAAAVRSGSTDLRLWSYPIWGWHLNPDHDLPGTPQGFRIDISAERGVKQQAIAAHKSQMSSLIEDDPTGFRFTEETLAPFTGPYEYVLAEDGDAP